MGKGLYLPRMVPSGTVVKEHLAIQITGPEVFRVTGHRAMYKTAAAALV